MNYFSSIHLVVYGFFLLTLLVGLYAGKNVKTFQDYATANRSLGPGTLTVTLLATMVSSNWLELIGYNYMVAPLIAGSIAVTTSISFLLMRAFLAPRLPRF